MQNGNTPSHLTRPQAVVDLQSIVWAEDPPALHSHCIHLVQAQRQALQAAEARGNSNPKTLVNTRAQIQDTDLDKHFVGEVQPARMMAYKQAKA